MNMATGLLTTATVTNVARAGLRPVPAAVPQRPPAADVSQARLTSATTVHPP